MSWKYESNPRIGPSEHELAAIDGYATSHGLDVARISSGPSHWFYWLRGKLSLSNLASIYVVSASQPEGPPRQIHVAFDPLAKSKGMQVLLEKLAP